MLSLTLNNCTRIYKHISSELNLKLVLKHIQHTFLPLCFCGPSSANDLLFFRFPGRHTLDAAHSVGRLWTKDQSDIENSVSQNNTQTKNCHALSGFENTISAGEQLKFYTLHLAETGNGNPSTWYISVVNTDMQVR